MFTEKAVIVSGWREYVSELVNYPTIATCDAEFPLLDHQL